MKTLALVLTLLLAAVGASADCNFALRSSDGFRLTASDATIDGNDLWVATSYGVALYDRTVDPPRPVSSIAIPGPTTRVRASAGLAYAGSGTRVHVVRKGRYLTEIRSVDLGANIADLLLSQGYLYAATSTGVVQLSLVDPESPTILNRLTTSSGQAFSLARLDATLYAADGDTTVEAYSLQLVTIPQKIGSFNSTVRAASVRTASGRLFVSDGFETEVLLGSGIAMTRLSSVPYGATSLFPSTGHVVFATGIDRRIRAIDFSLPLQPVLVFESELSASEGSVNRVQAMTGAPGRIYLAASDRGIATFNTESFVEPYPLVTNPAPLARSIVSLGDTVITADDEAGLRRYAQATNGRLAAQSPWDQVRRSIVHDAASERLLTSSGTLLNLWDLTKNPPERVGNVTFTSPIRSAVFAPPIAYAVLSDASLQRVDFSQTPAAAVKVTLEGAVPSYVARGGSAIAVVEVTEGGSTIVRYFGGGDLSSPPLVATLEGAATSGVGISGDGILAASTFKGISIVRFPNTTPEVLPASSSGPARGIVIAGSEVFVLSATALQVWDLGTKEMARSYALPTEPFAMSLSPDPVKKIVSIAAESGIVSILVDAPSRLPAEVPTANPNRYYRKVVATGTAILAGSSDRRAIDRFALTNPNTPRLQRTLRLETPAVDFAEIGGVVYTLSGGGKISAYGANDALLFEHPIEEGAPIAALSVQAVSGALWVSLLKSCPGAGCEQKTLVLDPRGARVVPTISMSGEVLDLATSGSRAYVLTTSPAEIRVFDTTDPYHPLMVASRASQGAATSIAYSAAETIVYTLGDSLRAYAETSLAESGAPVEIAGTAGVDQRLRLVGDCAVVTGRAFSAQLLSQNWQPLPSPSTPSLVRGVAVRDGVVYLLTDHSLEVWSTLADGRRRAAR
ncbi:MAG TPA: hypothetical protein VIL97_02755 [Thermoanaerobaculia bacterium]